MTNFSNCRAAHFASLANLQCELINIANPVSGNTGRIGVPIDKSVSVATRQSGELRGHTPNEEQDYGVYTNPTWTVLAQMCDAIEGGGKTFLTPSGRAALRLGFQLLPAGSHMIIALDDIYPGTYGLLDDLAQECGITYTMVPELTQDALAAVMRESTKMIFGEGITNPMCKVSDIRLIANFAKENNILSMIDNTCSPLAIRPLDYGIDLVVHSLTKYISGAANTIGGALVINKDRPDLFERLGDKFRHGGAIMAPETAHQIITLAQDAVGRTIQHYDAADVVAGFLSDQEEHVTEVMHPSLPSHPGHTMALNDFHGCGGGLVTFVLRGGQEAVKNFMAATQIVWASSLGTPRSNFYDFRAQSQGIRAMTEQDVQEKLRYPLGMVRLAIGRVGTDYIIKDIQRGFEGLRP